MILESFHRSDKSRLFSPSKGNQTKYHINNLWIKEDYLGYEAASEYLCSQILTYAVDKNHLPLEFVSYKMESGEANERPVVYCISEHFLKPGEQLFTLNNIWEKIKCVPFYKSMERLSTKERIETTITFIEQQLGISDAGQQLTLLLEFDAFVLNEDRHSNNIAFIQNAADGTFRFSPIFDNGAAFLSDTSAYPLQTNPRQLINTVKAKPFNVNFDKQLAIAEQLYGTQLFLFSPDLSKSFAEIENYYGTLIANRIRIVYEAQKEKYFPFDRQQSFDYPTER